ncbi:MAG TPA: OB-fold domain-containing protein [Pseudolabrys sp.]|nr:OB-fold domain-containing protein [Pseudolabrys sp.]
MNANLPQPRETPTNAPMLKAWRDDSALALQRCEDCGKAIFYPRSLCPHCWSSRLTWFRASGRGTIVSFSRIHRGLPEVFQARAPIVLAEIALAEDVRMIARVITADAAGVRSGMAVRLVPREQAQLYPLPTFEPG